MSAELGSVRVGQGLEYGCGAGEEEMREEKSGQAQVTHLIMNIIMSAKRAMGRGALRRSWAWLILCFRNTTHSSMSEERAEEGDELEESWPYQPLGVTQGWFHERVTCAVTQGPAL